MAERWRIEDVLDTIGDEHAREVLAAVNREPRSAKDIARECDLSLATVYRRIDLLERYDLVNERTLVADDGNHYKRYESNFESLVVSLDDEEYGARIHLDDALSDQFSRLWDDLDPG